MSRHLQRDLGQLEQELLAMSARVEQMIAQACQALRERRDDLAADVIEADSEVDQQEVHIEEECLKILALHQPVAIDLRLAAAVLKINNDLERIADLAASVAERAVDLGTYPAFTIPAALKHMADLANSMVRGALDAFVKLDIPKAREICERDEEVDQVFRQVIDELSCVMTRDPKVIDPALHCFSAARNIERMADHATNIAEDVIYLAVGEITRHKHPTSSAG